VTIVVGSDHAGLELRNHLSNHLKSLGHTVTEVGAMSAESFDYPNASDALVAEILENRASCGVLICGTGIGVSIRANRYPGIRAALCTSTEMAQMAVEHNQANVLCLGARILEEAQARAIVDTYLAAKPDLGERHVRRVQMLDGHLSCGNH